MGGDDLVPSGEEFGRSELDLGLKVTLFRSLVLSSLPRLSNLVGLDLDLRGPLFLSFCLLMRTRFGGVLESC